MIVCASRRTDIPAFHSQWMMNRLRAGFCCVRNPVSSEVYRVNLSPENVDCIEFMSKNPIPILPHLHEILDMGHRILFHVTLTPYGKGIEPHVPDKADVARGCVEMSEIVGRRNTAWRYDPVLFSDSIDIEYHTRKFETMCQQAQQWTDRCVFSFVDIYRPSAMYRAPTVSEAELFIRMASRITEEYGIRLDACCEGISSEGCFGKRWMESLGIPYEIGPPVRKGCKCVKAFDIGAYGTCGHGCVYCYATSSPMTCDEDSEILGRIREGETVTDAVGRRVGRIDDFFLNN